MTSICFYTLSENFMSKKEERQEFKEKVRIYFIVLILVLRNIYYLYIYIYIIIKGKLQ